MLQSSTLKFLKDLKKNNNKPWFEKNRDTYETARADFANFIQAVIDQYGKKDATIKNLVAKDCMFRINRDIRFSKDKTPYKTNFDASINKGGKKSMLAGYYFHLEPGTSFAGGGIWMPMRVPKGYEPGNPAADYLKLKSYIAMVNLKDTDLSSKDLVKQTAATFEALQPLINFVNEAISG